MRNKLLLRAINVIGAMSLWATIAPAHALQITLSVPDCPTGQSLTYTAGTNTLACSGTVTPPADSVPTGCTIGGNTTTAASPNPASTLITLSASCTGGNTPIDFTWSIAGIPVGTQSTLSTSPTLTTQYVVVPHNSIGNGTAASTTVYVGTPQAGSAPGSCFVTQSPNTTVTAVTQGTTVSMYVTCNSGSAPTSCSWTGGIASTACSVSVSAPATTTTYSVTPSNQYGPASAVSSTLNVTSTTGGGGSTGTNYCSGSDQIITVNWPSTGQVRPQTSGFANQRIAFKITIPTTFNPALNTSHLGFISMAEVPGTPPTPREITVSRNSCDFQSGSYLLNGLGYASTGPSFGFTVNNPTGYLSLGASVNFNSGDVIYVNVRNSNNGVPACGYSACDMLFDFATPNRY
jgi:hypothetical protein